MTRGIMSAGLLRAPDLARDRAQQATGTSTPEFESGETGSLRASAGWNPESFTREQIRGLVRQVFFSNAERLTRQVVFSALEPETEVRSICRRVGETLAAEIAGRVAVVGAYPRVIQGTEKQREATAATDENTPLLRVATRVRGNLWLVTDRARGSESGATASWNSFLGEVRNTFDYSIVQGALAGESDEATAMAQSADGIILVLSARHTRRATALKVKQALEAARVNILGTVLSDREFPIPDAVYRRL